VNLARVARVLAGFAGFYSLAQVIPLLIALSEPRRGSLDPVAGFVASIAIGLLVAAILWFAGRSEDRRFFRAEGLAVVGLAWLLASLLGAVPYRWSGAVPSAVDAIFETVSGLTTTGASVFGATALGVQLTFHVEDLPASILFWRSFTQLIGGIGIVLVFVALLPAMGVTSKSLLVSEQVGVANEGFQPRMLDQARGLLVVYLGLTAACGVLLWLFGMPWFDAMCHSFTTLATGGFSTFNLSLQGSSPAVLAILTFFMFVAGCNFAVLAATFRSGPLGPGALFRDLEFRAYLVITLLLVGGLTAALLATGRAMGDSALHAAFNAVSVYTSTGYASEDFQRWPLPAIVLLFGSMLVGASSGSTAGGLKVIRFLVGLKLIAYSLRHYVRPKSIERIKLGDEPIAAATISAILALFLLWFAGLFVGTVLLALGEQLTFLSAMSMSASLLGCCGPSLCPVGADGAALGIDVGPMGSYGALGTGSKIVGACLMILGRLEFLAPLALFMPTFWRR
jgi:trk system potassium uptake protein TrkH